MPLYIYEQFASTVITEDAEEAGRRGGEKFDIQEDLVAHLTRHDAIHHLVFFKIPNLGAVMNTELADALRDKARHIYLLDCAGVGQMFVPEGTSILQLKNCGGRVFDMVLPASLVTLELGACPDVMEISRLPPTLQSFTIRNCPKWEVVPELPAQLTNLSLWNLPALITVPPLPARLVSLHIGDCTALEEVHQFPPLLEEFSLDRCPLVESVPDFPAGLRRLSTIGSDALRLTDAQREHLALIKNAARQPPAPVHYDTLREAIQGVRHVAGQPQAEPPLWADRAVETHLDDSQPAALLNVIARVLSESPGARRDTARAMMPMLDLLEQRPELLGVAEQAAAQTRQGCVNQPVNSWAAIGAMLDFSRDAATDDLADARGPARQLMARDSLNMWVAEQARLPGAALGVGVEVEAANEILRRVHARKVADDRQAGCVERPWLGVPEQVCHVGFVRDWVTEARVDAAYAHVKAMLDPQQTSAKDVSAWMANSPYSAHWNAHVQDLHKDEAAAITRHFDAAGEKYMESEPVPASALLGDLDAITDKLRESGMALSENRNQQSLINLLGLRDTHGLPMKPQPHPNKWSMDNGKFPDVVNNIQAGKLLGDLRGQAVAQWVRHKTDAAWADAPAAERAQPVISAQLAPPVAGPSWRGLLAQPGGGRAQLPTQPRRGLGH